MLEAAETRPYELDPESAFENLSCSIHDLFGVMYDTGQESPTPSHIYIKYTEAEKTA